LIEIWETFLLQLDAEDEVPGQTIQPSDPDKTPTLNPNESSAKSVSGSTLVGEGQLAAATDVALERDAEVNAGDGRRDPDA
jgi:hypothetical protein